jgi:hypothetical protein
MRPDVDHAPRDIKPAHADLNKKQSGVDALGWCAG